MTYAIFYCGLKYKKDQILTIERKNASKDQFNSKYEYDTFTEIFVAFSSNNSDIYEQEQEDQEWLEKNEITLENWLHVN